jgi:hypothetical protein
MPVVSGGIACRCVGRQTGDIRAYCRAIRVNHRSIGTDGLRGIRLVRPGIEVFGWSSIALLQRSVLVTEQEIARRRKGEDEEVKDVRVASKLDQGSS